MPAQIMVPQRGVPGLAASGQTITITIRGASYGSGWSAVCKSDLMTGADAGWPLTNITAATSGGNTTLTATIPSTISPELLDLFVSHASVGTLVAYHAVKVRTDANPTTLKIGLRTDTHVRTDSVSSSGTDEEKRAQYRTDDNLEDQNEAWSLLNPDFILNAGDLGYAVDASGDTKVNGSDSAKFVQLTRPMTVAEFIVMGNHDSGRKEYPNAIRYEDDWEKNIGQRYGVQQLTANLRLVWHDYTDDTNGGSKDTTLANLGSSFTGSTLVLQHHDSNWYAVDLKTRTDFLFCLIGHDHHTEIRRTTPRVQMLSANHKWGQSYIMTLTKSGNTWGYGSSLDGVGGVKFVGDYGAKLCQAQYSKPSDGTSLTQTVNIKNDIKFGNSDGRVRLVMKSGTYSVNSGTATILFQYQLAGAGKTVVIVRVNIPANGSASFGVTSSGAPPEDDPETPPDTTSRKLPYAAFYGQQTTNANGAALSPSPEAVLAPVTGLYIIRTRSDIGTGNPYDEWIAAGGTDKALLYQRPPTEVQVGGDLRGSQLWPDVSILQAVYDAMVNDPATRLYGAKSSGGTLSQALTSGSNADIKRFDPAHSKVRAFAKAAVLWHATTYTWLKGIFFDNVGVFGNADDTTGKVFSGGAYTANNGEYSSSTLDAQEQALLLEVRSHLDANLPSNRKFILGGNLLSGSQQRDYRPWPLTILMWEAAVGYVQSSGLHSADRTEAMIQRAREFLNASPNNGMIFVGQGNDSNDTSAFTKAFGMALVCMQAGTTPEGFPRTTFRGTNYNQYGRYAAFDTEYGDIGLPKAEPIISGNTAKRTFTQGEITLQTDTKVWTKQTLPPDDVDPTPPEGQIEFPATLVGVRADLPNDAIRNGSVIAIDGNPRAAVLVKVALRAGLPAPTKVILAVPVELGSPATPHVQLVEAFDESTVTWATRKPALSQSYSTNVPALVGDTTVELDVTEIARRRVGDTLYMAILMDAEQEPLIFPYATLVWK